MTIVLKMKSVSRSFQTTGGTLEILKDVNLELSSGEAVALRGPSGCGKSTLLHLAGALDEPTSGEVQVLSENPWDLDASKLAAFRNQHIGFVFQEHQLLPQCSVLENVLLPALAGFGDSAKKLQSRAQELLEQVGLAERMTHRPAALSGGERQRVSVCRALIHQPSLLLADEPTGNLDPVTAESVGQLLLKMAAEHKAGLLCVTHSDQLAGSFPHVAMMGKGTVRFSTADTSS